MPRLWDRTIDAHRETVRGAILDAAWRLAVEHGLTGVTMAGVAALPGLGGPRSTATSPILRRSSGLGTSGSRGAPGSAHQLGARTRCPCGTAPHRAGHLGATSSSARGSRTGPSLGPRPWRRGHSAGAQGARLARGGAPARGCRREHSARRRLPGRSGSLLPSCPGAARCSTGKNAVEGLVAVTLDGVRSPLREE